MALLCVLAAIVYLYASAGLRLFSTWRQGHRASAAVHRLQVENRALVQAHERLAGQAALEAQARRLGMTRPGEQPYAVSGLPSD